MGRAREAATARASTVFPTPTGPSRRTCRRAVAQASSRESSSLLPTTPWLFWISPILSMASAGLVASGGLLAGQQGSFSRGGDLQVGPPLPASPLGVVHLFQHLGQPEVGGGIAALHADHFLVLRLGGPQLSGRGQHLRL